MGKKGLVGIVVVSHSNKLAQEIINLAEVFKQDNFNIENGGNAEKETYGTNKATVIEAIKRANSGSGVLVFVDMGSSVFHAVKAKEELDGEIEVEIADAPLVEGIISAVAVNFDEISLQELKLVAEESKNSKKIR